MLATIQDVAGKTFDYIIVGGGTVGLTLAARLVAIDSSPTVLVLEAGEAHLDNTDILKDRSGSLLRNQEHAYRHEWVIQEHAAGRSGIWERGKGLGGSSAINYMAWFRPPRKDYDDWERLGNPGWNYNNLIARINRVEGLCELPPDAPAREHIDTEGWNVGRDGPIKLSYADRLGEGELSVMEAFRSDGFKRNTLAYNGDPTGYYLRPSTRDPVTGERSYATTAYYKPNADRENLTVLVAATVHRVLLKPSGNEGEVVITGVEFTYERELCTVNARKEVVLSAGAITTPQILELSGIGQEDVLARIGVPIRVTLPGVGENLQEHIYIGVTHELKEGKGAFQSGTGVAANLSLADLTPRAPELHERIDRVLSKLEEEVSNLEPHNRAQGDLQVKRGLLEQYKLLSEKHSAGENGSPGFQWIVSSMFDSSLKKLDPGKRYIIMRSVLNHGLSRGTIHSVSNDPTASPEIDPHYLCEDIDLEMMYEHLVRTRHIASQAPLKDIIAAEVYPGPECTTEDDVKDWIRRSLVTIFHTVGTCSMLPRDKGGVVSTELKVYGTKNLRIADVSIIPLHVGANILSTAYGIGEIAGDIIEGKWAFTHQSMLPLSQNPSRL